MKDSVSNGHPIHLIESVDEFDSIRLLLTKEVSVGCDTETTGLDKIKDKVVGICISCGKSMIPQHYHGFYIPIRHRGYDKNIPVKDAIALTQEIVDNYKTIWWNRNYDADMLEKDGFKMPYVGHTHDAQCMAHLLNGESFPALKKFASIYLKYKVTEYSENNAEGGDFGSTDPQVSFGYAALDPIITALLSRKFWLEYPYIRKIYKLDNVFAETIRYFCNRAELFLDKNLLQKELDDVRAEQAKIKAEIFAITGYEFRLTAAQDKADALMRFVTLTAKTPNGKYATDEETLEKIDHPLAKLMIKWAKLEKQAGTYLKKMLTFPQPFHIKYHHCNVSTGRMSSGGDKGNDFFAPFNIQNVPKEEMARYLHKGGILGYSLSDDPLVYTQSSDKDAVLRDVLAIEFTDGSEITISPNAAFEYNGQVLQPRQLKVGDRLCCKEIKSIATQSLYCKGALKLMIDGVNFYGAIGKHKAKGGMRDAFICPDGYVWLSCDYSSEEVVLIANFSGEKNLIEPLLEGKDIHRYIGERMFDHYDPMHRTVAKTITFASNYGGTAYTIAKRLGVSQEQGEEYLKKYNEALPQLTRWKQEMIKEARHKGMVFTYFGRPRTLYQYYNSSDYSKHGYADRSAMNTPVQGTGGDLIRMDHIKLRQLFENDPEWAANVKYALTVHDEIDLFVKPCYAKQAAQKLQDLMFFFPSNFKVPVKTSPSIGEHWGVQIEFDSISDDNKIILNDFEGKSLEELYVSFKESHPELA